MKESAHTRRQPFSRLVRTTRSVQVPLNYPDFVYQQNGSIRDAFLYAVTPARVCDMWNVKQEYDSHYSFPPPRIALIVATISPTSEFSGKLIFASISTFIQGVKFLWHGSFQNACNVLGMSYVWQSCCFKQEVSTCFLLCIRYHHTHTRTQIQLEVTVKE